MDIKKSTYISLASLIFVFAGLLHAWRLVNGWDIYIGSTLIPAWVSALVVLLLAFMAYKGYRLNK